MRLRRMKLKICVVGERAVGKTSLIERYAKNNFSSADHGTLGAYLYPVDVDVKADAKAEAKTEDIKPVYRHLTKRSYLDARECLKKKTNEEIIICAEKFL